MIPVCLEAFPLMVLSLYLFGRQIKGKGKRGLVFLPVPAIAAGLWYGIALFCGRSMAAIAVLTLLELFSFEVLQVRNRRMSLWYHGLFYLLTGIIAANGIKVSGSRMVSEYILLLLYFLTEGSVYYLKKTYEENTILYQNQLLTKQVNEVQNIYMTMRGWRHDYHNHLQTLKAHLKVNQIEEARGYLDRLENDLDSIHSLIESGNVNLDAILNSKLSLALKDEINIHYRAEVPKDLTVSDIDLCVLIGNLIDNAVESCNKMTEEEGKRFIRLYVGVLKKQLYISVANATDELVRKLDEDYITAKRGNHGHGLKRINNIVEKYEGYINRKNEPGVFVTEIMLPL